jgi:hypothetical protein
MEHNQSHSFFLLSALPGHLSSLFSTSLSTPATQLKTLRRLRHVTIRLIYQQDRGKACERCGFRCIEEFLFGNLHGLHPIQCDTIRERISVMDLRRRKP